MASNILYYDDGNQTGVSAGSQRFTVPVQDGPKRTFYPFKKGPVPDVSCVITERDFLVRKSYDVELINLTTLNGGFETAGGGGADVFADWTETVGTGTLTRDTSNSHSGSACAKWVNGGLLQSALLTQNVLTPGKTYAWSLWAKSETGAALYGFSIYDGSGLRYTAATLTTSWVKYEGAFVANSAVFGVSLNGGLSTPAVFVDDVILREVDSVEAFDESSIIGVTKSFTNKFLYSSDFTNAAWAKSNTGTGVLPVTTAGYTGPDGALPAWRVQLDRGAGTGLSQIVQNRTGLANPHDQAISFWYKSNTGGTNYFAISYYDYNTQVVKVLAATTKWKQFWITNNVSDTVSSLVLFTQNGLASDQVVDILFSSPQFDIAAYIGPYIPTTSAEVTRSLAYVDGVSTPKIYGNNQPFMDYDQDSLAWIVDESEPVHTGVGNLLRFTRRFARIPANQVIASSKYIDRPSVHGAKSGTAYGVSFRDGYDHIFTSRKTAGGSYTNPAVTTTNPLPGTNITITDSGGNVATFAANASKATIDAALASLTALTYKVATVWDTNRISITWSGTVLSYTYPTGVIPVAVRLSSVGTSLGLIQFNSTGSTTSLAVTTFPCPSHGGVVGDKVAFWEGDSLLGTSTVSSVPDTDTFSCLTDALDIDTSLVTHCAFSTDAAYCVATGPKMCSIRLTQRYYLPGYTTGIATAADITPPATATDPVSWLAAIVAGTAWVVDAVTDLKSWEGPILVQETSEVQMSDAIDSATP